jgi:integrase
VATIDFRLGLIRDRARDVGLISYYVPKDSKPFMEACLKAHEFIISLLGYNRLNKADLRANVLRYAVLDAKGRRELMQSLVSGLNGEQKQTPASSPVAKAEADMEAIADMWLEQKLSDVLLDRDRVCFNRLKTVLLKFCKETGIATTSDLDYETAVKFKKWREGMAASTVKKELQVLKQWARLAKRRGFIPDGSLWDDIKVKAIVGINKKVVEPLTIEAQIELLNSLKNKPEHHDTALLYLITGMRLSELKTLNKDSIQNGALTLHGDGVGNCKTTGKTASANRTLPVCPVLLKLFERGYIFKIKPTAFRTELTRHHKGIHAHRLRHSFAVNNLLAKRDLQMVSYEMGHAQIGITSDRYGKFVPHHFKLGFEETTRIRQAHLQWLENDYPL